MIISTNDLSGVESKYINELSESYSAERNDEKNAGEKCCHA